MGAEQGTERPLRIGEFARLAGVTVRTVRYYEELGLLGSGTRRESGAGRPGGARPSGIARQGSAHRRYSERDLLYLRRIQQLKSYDLTLGEIREITDLSGSDPSGEKRRVRLLARYREKLREAEARRSALDRYIGELRWHVEQLEEVGSFQDCPGRECARCRHMGVCNFARSAEAARRAGAPDGGKGQA